MSVSLRTQGLQHTRLPCPPLSPRICSNSCPFSQWCHPIISSSVAPFSSCPQCFPASGSFPMSWLFASGVKVLELQLQPSRHSVSNCPQVKWINGSIICPVNLESSFQPLHPNSAGPSFLKNIHLLYLCGCTKSQLQHWGSSIFIVEGRIFFVCLFVCSMWMLSGGI